MRRANLNLWIAALMFCALHAASAQSTTVTLMWDENHETDITGYRLHYGTATGAYTQVIDVGNSTLVTVPNLPVGPVYFFAATAYNAANIESLPSNEVAYVSSAQTPTPTPSATPIHTPTPTPTAIPNPTMTPTPTPTPIHTPTPTPNPTITPTPTPTPVHTPSATPNVTPTPTATPGPTVTPSPTPTPVHTPTPAPTATPATASLVNVSTRLLVQTGDSVMIGGFIVAGEVPKNVLLRAIGPSLANFGVSGAMADPVLTLHDSTGAVIASNDNWRSNQSQLIQDTGLAPTDDREAALVTTLPAGAYTAVVSAGDEIPGVALFEFYDLAPASSQLANLSTRGKVETEDRVMIGGFIISGDHPTPIIVRAIGPSLAQLGIPEVLVDPTLELHNGDGSLIVQNDNWRSDQEQQILDSAMAPSDDRESAIIATLNPGPYSAIVRGTGNSTGVALVEIYKLTP